MWNGSRPGPRGGHHFGGNPRGEMFQGRGGPMMEFRGRDGINMGPRPQDRRPMDMRRFDGPPDMRARNMNPLNMDLRGREPNFFRQGENADIALRRQYELDIRNKLKGFVPPGRHPMEMGGRDMQGGNSYDRFPDVRDQERRDMHGFNAADARRRLPGEPLGRIDGFRDMCDRDRPRMGMDNMNNFRMDMPQPDRGLMDFNRRGGMQPPNPRGRFESDMDMRNRMGPSGEFKDRSPLRFGDKDGRPDIPPNIGDLNRPAFRPGEPTLRDREFPEQRDGPVGFRGMEGESLSDEWRKHSMRDSFTGPPPHPRELAGERLAPGRGREGMGEPRFPDRNKPSEFPAKDDKAFGYPCPERDGKVAKNWEKNIASDNFPGRDAPRGAPGQPFPPVDPGLAGSNRENDCKPWQTQTEADRGTQRTPYLHDKGPAASKDGPFSNNITHIKESKDIPLEPTPHMGALGSGQENIQMKSGGEGKDQDYRDIDYRTASGRTLSYDIGDLPLAEKAVKEPKLTPPPRPGSSGSQDQDYRSATVNDSVSSTISISGIPKTATMQQILGAFAVRDGVPTQGMKIKNVVPGYSYDTAYVEFLNLEDAVGFMDSNQGSLKVGSKMALMKYVHPEGNDKDVQQQVPDYKAPQAPEEALLPSPIPPAKTQPKQEETQTPTPVDPLSRGAWQRSCDLTPEAWQQQVDQLQQQEAEQQAEAWTNRSAARLTPLKSDPIFKESKTMIIKNVKPSTTVELILKALDPYAYLDDKNVRLVRGKPPGSKCFCFVDMDSHEQVTRLVELLTKPRPLIIDGVRVYAEVAKPLKNQNYRKDFDKSTSSILGFPPDIMEQHHQYFPSQPHHTPVPSQPSAHADFAMPSSGDSQAITDSHINNNLMQPVGYADTMGVNPSFMTADLTASTVGTTAQVTTPNNTDSYSYGSENPDLSAYLYDATSGFYYDPQTTLYYDPNSRYYYNADTQQYLYWDNTSKTYIPVSGSTTDTQPSVPIPAVPEEVSVPPPSSSSLLPTPSLMPPPAVCPATDDKMKTLESPPEKREDDDTLPRSEKKDKEDKPRSLAAFKIMKDMERWAKIQNRQKDSVRAPSPVLKTPIGSEDKASKAADAAFAIFERKGTADDLFKKPLAPPRKDEKSSKRPMGSLGMLAADYAAGSDEEEEEKMPVSETQQLPKSQSEEKEDKLTDWKKIACLLCRRQFPNKDALIRHQQLSDLHKQNMEIHLKIKRSKRELEALENQEKELTRECTGMPEMKRKKHQNNWASSSRDINKGSERPGLGAEPVERKKKEPVVWNHATYKQAVRNAMFARFKELD
ncbi:RNA-binding protein 6 isoform X2 [Denticeps clupeoides]|uniref:RNA-binding protein 6 isoform X2 n=1 Tax=Denticeps clupeoides TaxID=299321 RepID=UPI0010A3A4D8|nr:RNA-binding protein 6-like isoform X2 [Denticeps clupeoides]